jgi:hypothetical protein
LATRHDHYAILQVPRNASQEEIERAYKRLSERYDPETSRKMKASERHAQITEAYNVLSDRTKRREYDRELSRRNAAAGSMLPSEVLSNRFMIIGAGVVIVSIIAVLAAIILLAGDGGDEEIVANPSPTAATPTPIPTPSGPPPSTPPDAPPEVAGTPVTTASGLQLITIQEGTGAAPTTADQVQVWYTGWLHPSGPKFDSAIDRGAPAVFQVTGVVDGFSEALLSMKEGGITRAIMPPELGYGEAGSPPNIPGNATLIFDIELLRVIPGTTPTPTVAATTPAADTPAADTPTALATPTP